MPFFLRFFCALAVVSKSQYQIVIDELTRNTTPPLDELGNSNTNHSLTLTLPLTFLFTHFSPPLPPSVYLLTYPPLLSMNQRATGRILLVPGNACAAPHPTCSQVCYYKSTPSTPTQYNTRQHSTIPPSPPSPRHHPPQFILTHPITH